MKTALIAFVLWGFCLSGLVFAQDFQRAEVFGGYSYLNIDTNGLTSRQSMNGWETSLSVNFNKWVAAEGDFSGYYKGYGALGVSARASDYGYVFGPRFNYRPNDSFTVFGHTLFGGDHLGGSVSGSLFGYPVSASASQNGFAMAFGGGVQQRIAKHFAVRGGADWVLTHHNVFGGNSVDQNNFRLSVGVVYTFGGVGKQAAAPQQQGVPSGSAPQQSVDLQLGKLRLEKLGLSGEVKSVYGFTVTGVAPNSPAAQSGIAVGDYIVAVNAKPIKTADDLFSVLSVSSGKVVISTSNPLWLSNHTQQHELVIE
jgi:hypothetical protein